MVGMWLNQDLILDFLVLGYFGFLGETEPKGYIYIYIYIYIDPYYKELAHMSMKVEESHDLPSGDSEKLMV